MKSEQLRFFIFFFCIAGSLTAWSQQYDRSGGFVPVTGKSDNRDLIDYVELMYRERPYNSSLSAVQNTQLKSHYKKRLEACKELLQGDDVIVSGDLFNYVNGIFQKLLLANPEISQQSKLVLYRNLTFNAFTMGNNVVFVHVGLLNKLYTEEELAFVLGHELAHNALKHAESNMISQVLQNDTLKKQISQAAGKTYGNVTALNELLLPTILANKEQSRRNEYASDSLGILIYLKAGYDPAQSIGFFQALDGEEGKAQEPPLDLAALFNLQETDPLYKKAIAYRKANSLGIFEKDNEMEPYLRSHPYDADRLKAVLRIIGLTEEQTFSVRDSVYMSYRYLSDGEMVYKCLRDGLLSRGFYYSAKMDEVFPGDIFTRNSLAFILTELSYMKDRRISGKYIDTQSPNYEEAYDRAVFFLQSLVPLEAQALSEKLMEDKKVNSEEVLMNQVTKAFWAFQHADYSQYELRYDMIREAVKGTLYEPFLLEVDRYYLTSGKKRITNNNK